MIRIAKPLLFQKTSSAIVTLAQAGSFSQPTGDRPTDCSSVLIGPTSGSNRISQIWATATSGTTKGVSRAVRKNQRKRRVAADKTAATAIAKSVCKGTISSQSTAEVSSEFQKSLSVGKRV